MPYAPREVVLTAARQTALGAEAEKQILDPPSAREGNLVNTCCNQAKGSWPLSVADWISLMTAAVR